jgi:hypothetical protein
VLFEEFASARSSAAAEEAELAAATARCARVALGRGGSPLGCRDAVFVVSAARVGFSQSAIRRQLNAANGSRVRHTNLLGNVQAMCDGRFRPACQTPKVSDDRVDFFLPQPPALCFFS